ncbi:MAG: RnfH family protein [Pseudomonadota bacterium]
MSGELTVEVIYALPAVQRLKRIAVPPGTTVQQAIERSGILQDFPEIDLTKNKVGVFGKLTRLDAPLKDRDRVEIYRPLIADPKEVRRRRVEAGSRRKAEG